MKSGSLPYVPDRGDIVKLNFSPQEGHEQSGYRPALILSPIRYNKLSSLALMCPISDILPSLTRSNEQSVGFQDNPANA